MAGNTPSGGSKEKNHETAPGGPPGGAPQRSGSYKNKITVVVLVIVVGILIVIGIPAYQDYAIRAQVQEDTNLANPARTALGVACREGTLELQLDNEQLRLAPATAYGKRSLVVSSVEAASHSAETGTVTITFRDMGNEAIKEGAQVVYKGQCASGNMTWTVEPRQGFPEKYLPST